MFRNWKIRKIRKLNQFEAGSSRNWKLEIGK